MMHRGWGGALLALALCGFAHAAWASVWHVTCPGSGATTLAENSGAAVDFPADPGGLTGTGNVVGAPDALGALMGTPSQNPENLAALGVGFNANLASGDLIEITGICQQDVFSRSHAYNLTITNHNGVRPLGTPPVTTDGVQGQLEFIGESIFIEGLEFGSSAGQFAFQTAADTAAVLALASHITIEDSVIEHSPLWGLELGSDSSATLWNTTVQNNGFGTNPNETAGVAMFDGSSVLVGELDGTFPATIQNNAGDGILAVRGGAVHAVGATISGNGEKQIDLRAGSAATVTGSSAVTPTATVTAPANNTDAAISAIGSSGIITEFGATVTGGTSGTAIAVEGSSAALLQGSIISSGDTTIDVSGTSTVALAGGNIICHGTISGGNTCNPTTGAAFFVTHVGALVQAVGIPDFGFTPAQDMIFGSARIQLQSTVDIGSGLVSGQPSIVWTTGTGGISAAQNSSLRLQGGVEITGAIFLLQGSNGFFNKSNGGTNDVSDGVSCPWVNIPSAHIAVVGGSLSPAPTLSVSPLPSGTAANQCLAF
jgi:hypothetical protein